MNILSAVWQYKGVRVIIGVLTIGVSWALSLLVAKSKGKSEGRKEAEVEGLEEMIEIVKEKEAVHEEVNAYSDDDHIDLLQK